MAVLEQEFKSKLACVSLDRSSLAMKLAIFRGEELLIVGSLVYVYADAHAKQSVEIPAHWREKLQ